MFLLTIIVLKVIYSRYTNWLTHSHTQTHTHTPYYNVISGRQSFVILRSRKKLSCYLGKTNEINSLSRENKISLSRDVTKMILLSRENLGNKMYDFMAV